MPESASSTPLPSPRDALNAAARLMPLPIEAPGPHSGEFARASIFFPLIGLVIGVLNLGTYHLANITLPTILVLPLTLLVWLGLAADWRDVPLPWFLAQLGLKLFALLHISHSAAGAFLFAPLLGTWSIVVVATGTRNAAAPERKFNARINFQEFAIASVATAGVMFTLAQAFGIVLFACAGAVVLVVRLLAHRLGTGVSWKLLRMNAQGIELLVCGLFAALT